MADSPSGGGGYDIGAATTNQVTPQGSVGGGNVFTMAPLFGSIYGQTSASYGSNTASTSGGSAAASGKGPAGLTQDSSGTTATAAPAVSTASYTTYALIGAAVLGLFALVWAFKK